MSQAGEAPAQAIPNHFAELISACDNSASKIQAAYSTHRTSRNELSRTSFLCPKPLKLPLDPYLLLTKSSPSPYGPDGTPLDPRNSLVLWARPPEHILQLASHIQAKLKDVAPNLWLMPTHRMHTTTFELAFSRTAQEITALLTPLRPYVPLLTNVTYSHRARLVKPLLSYDLSGVALSFVPASGEPLVSPAPSPAGVEDHILSLQKKHILSPKLHNWPPPPTTLRLPGSKEARDEADRETTEGGKIIQGDAYTYHHLRDSITNLVGRTGVPVRPRYNAPSAHVTLARYITQEDHDTAESRRRWVAAIEEINAWLEAEVWNVEGGEFIGEWIVGQEQGLDLRCGAAWYGGGRSIMVGEGF